MSDKIPCDVILLAAGSSLRMGTDKLLLELGKKNILQHITETLHKVSSNIILVQGSVDLSFMTDSFPNMTIVHNPHHKKGMGTSLKKGLELCHTDYVFVHLADVPFIDYRTFYALYERKTPDSLCIPVYKGQKGHPRLLPQKAIQLVLTSSKPKEPREIFQALDSILVDVDDQGSVFDIDTAEQYKKALLIAEQRKIP